MEYNQDNNNFSANKYFLTCSSWICDWYLWRVACTADIVLSAKAAGEVILRAILLGDLKIGITHY